MFKKITQKLNNAPKNAITPHLISDCIKPRRADMHKGDCGRLFVCAGSIGLTGAAILATKTALRCGSGLVTLGCCDSLNTIFEICLTETMTMPMPSENGKLSYSAIDDIIANANKSNAILAGPGLSQSDDLHRLINDLVPALKVPAVMDADALNLISQNPSILKKAKNPIIITPHIGEFSRLTGKPCDEILSDTQSFASDFSVRYGCITVLKSHRTVVAMPSGEVYINMLGNPGMATGGCGDVLSGAIASFLAQGNTARDAALCGVFLHSLAADMAVLEFGEYSLIASDIIKYIPYAIQETAKNIRE